MQSVGVKSNVSQFAWNFGHAMNIMIVSERRFFLTETEIHSKKRSTLHYSDSVSKKKTKNKTKTTNVSI